jgi:hypothetical protein
MPVLNLQQGSPEWLAARVGVCTASRFKDALSVLKGGGSSAKREDYKFELIAERLTGEAVSRYVTSEMQWGVDNEPAARVEYAWSRQVEVVEVGFYRHETLQAGASPDGILEGGLGSIEIKSPTTRSHLETLCNGMDPAHLPQIYGQQWLTGAKWTDFISYDPRLPSKYRLYVERVHRDEAAIQKIAAGIEAFLAEVAALEMTIKEKTSNE